MATLQQNIPVTVFNSSLSQVAYIDDYETASFEHAWYKPGSFNLTINWNKPNAQTFWGFDPQTNPLYVMWNNDPNRFAKVTHVSNTLDETGKGGQTVTVSGFECWHMFNQRVMVPFAGTSLYNISGNPEYCIKQMISDQAGATAFNQSGTRDTNRTFALLSVATNQNRYQSAYPSYIVQAQNTNLLDELSNCAVASQMGIVAYPNFSTGQIVVDVQLGVDRHLGNSAGNPVCVFSSSYDDSQKVTQDIMEDNYANFAYVRGSGSSGLQAMVTLPSTGIPAAEQRYELFVDASAIPQTDPTLVADMTAWGNQILAQNQFKNFFQVDPLAYSPYVYTVDYNVGDLVTVQDFNITQTCRLISVVENIQHLEYTLTSTFDKPVPDLTDQMQAMFAQLTSIVNNSQATPVYTTNASGKAVQFSDGTMIVFINQTLVHNTAYAWPVNFSATPSPGAPVIINSSGSPTVGFYALSATGFTLDITGGGTYNVSMAVLGRWK